MDDLYTQDGVIDMRVRLLACEDLFEKSLWIVDFSILREHLNNLAQRIRQFSRAQPQDHLSFVQQIRERDSHKR